MFELGCPQEDQIQSLQCLSMRSAHSSNLKLLPYSRIGRLNYLERRGPRIFHNSLEFVDQVSLS